MDDLQLNCLPHLPHTYVAPPCTHAILTPSGLGGRYHHFIGHIRKLLGIFENNLGLCGEFPLVSMSTTPPSDVSYDFKYILSFYDIIMV